MTRIQDLQATQTFRLDHNGYAGRSYTLLGDGRIRASDGRTWSLEDCGLTPSTVIGGPVWGATNAAACHPFARQLAA